MFRNLERADYLSLNPHKWLYVPIDKDYVIFSRIMKARAAFSFEGADYIKKSMNKMKTEAFCLLELRPGTVATIAGAKESG